MKQNTKGRKSKARKTGNNALSAFPARRKNTANKANKPVKRVKKYAKIMPDSTNKAANLNAAHKKLLNKTRKTVISHKVVLADSVFKKFRGLMFEKWNRFNYALVFPFEKASRHGAAIHMFFVFFPIDVVYLRRGTVVDCFENVAPFTPFLAPKTSADMLIELPRGLIGKKKIAPGDIIVIE